MKRKEDCLFCKIVAGEIPAARVYEDEQFLVFKDIQPAAPVHLLIVPKEHYQDILELSQSPEGPGLLGHLAELLPQLVAQQGLERGFRLLNNCGPEGGQTVLHLHFHLLGGEPLGERLR